MPKRQPLPRIWLVSDERNDAALERALLRLPRGSGLIYRHYHLAAKERRRRFDRLKTIAHFRRHVVALSGDAVIARRWGADAAYGPPRLLARGPATLRLITAHSLREVAQAQRARADAIFLSPVFPTRSHPSAKVLGPLRFRLLTRIAQGAKRTKSCPLGGGAERSEAVGARRIPPPTRLRRATSPMGGGLIIIALGGMNPYRARHIGAANWAAIDSFLR